MTTIAIEGQPRAEGSKPRALRRDGLIPANLYGHKGTESISLTLPQRAVERLLRDATPNNTLIQLSIPELPWRGSTLLREVQKHPWKGSIYHLSFFSIASQESIEVNLRLRFVGEAQGVRVDQGVLDPVLTELQVACAPDNIPETLDIDVSQLQVGDALHVSELVLPSGVVAVGEPSRVVVSVLQTRAEASETGAAAAG